MVLSWTMTRVSSPCQPGQGEPYATWSDSHVSGVIPGSMRAAAATRIVKCVAYGASMIGNRTRWSGSGHSHGYPASFGMTRSANPKNRWLRAPATNFTKPRKRRSRRRARPRSQSQHRRQRPRTSIRSGAFGSSGQGIRRISSTKARICSRAAPASSPASASCSAATFARYNSPRFGSSRGAAGFGHGEIGLQRSARGRRVRPSSLSTGRQARPSRRHPSRPGCRSSPVRVRGDCSSARRCARPAACSTRP